MTERARTDPQVRPDPRVQADPRAQGDPRAQRDPRAQDDPRAQVQHPPGRDSQGVHHNGQRTDPSRPEAPTALLSARDLEAVNRRWHDIQSAFVDSPQQAVKEADALVADLMNRLMSMFAAERQHLESQWSRGADVSTEDLRVSLQRYRSFFQRLLAVH